MAVDIACIKRALLLFFSIYYFSIWQHIEARYATDTNTRMKHKIMALDKDLVYDSVAKRTAIDWIRKHHSKYPIFHYANVVYDVRMKYARMVQVFMKASEDIEELKLNKVLTFLVEVQHLALDIDNMIQMLEEFEDKDTIKKRITRNGPSDQEKLLNRSRELKELILRKEKQRNYMERKKMLWSMSQGASKQNLTRVNFSLRNKMVEGFESDI